MAGALPTLWRGRVPVGSSDQAHQNLCLRYTTIHRYGKERAVRILSAQVGLLFLLVSPCPVMGQKPQDVIEHSNGFPSGAHFNL